MTKKIINLGDYCLYENEIFELVSVGEYREDIESRIVVIKSINGFKDVMFVFYNELTLIENQETAKLLYGV